jgi:hypothetical protein
MKRRSLNLAGVLEGRKLRIVLGLEEKEDGHKRPGYDFSLFILSSSIYTTSLFPFAVFSVLFKVWVATSDVYQSMVLMFVRLYP